MTGISLKKQLGFSDFSIYEKGNDLGGTWHWNTYPGCASDIGTHWYTLSSDLNPDWDRTHVPQPQLKAYWKRLAAKYDIGGHITYLTKVVAAEWDPERQIYRVELLDLRSGETRTEYAKVVISAIGVLDTPHYPEDLKGIQTTFKGEHFHSARWNWDVDLHNKRVAVIGNGCSAAQFVPVISEDPTTQVLSFCRTPSWIFPWLRPIPGYWQKIFKYVPFAMRLYRWIIVIQVSYVLTSPVNKRREAVANDLIKYMKENAPEEYHERLTPRYSLGCKRFIIDSGYYESLHRSNNDITYDGIDQITENGILTKTGQHHEFDVIIQATGFIADEYPITIRGNEGTIQQYYRIKNGPEAYKGTTFPGFPNFFMVFGPNTATGHGSVIFTEEVQINYIMQMLDPIIKGSVSSFEVTHEASDAWNAHTHKKLSTSVWSVCQSWYRTGRTGKNANIWPGSLTNQWWQLRSPIWSHYKVVGGERWERRRMMKRVWRTVEVATVVGVVAYASLYPERTAEAFSQVKELVCAL
ncbi:FAD/NAD-P-binding domain-containing protein [Cristinia sonorae]|uniref:FAD/NAD-P-binding domain-containing protein n=1 Tax=Cristinia sonorae TaxID=1940300 RepID=A0A8K0UN46_9AGAR|nr:FAD/NAD-P-binding domain-containing protein [Cristinia sonorae]